MKRLIDIFASGLGLLLLSPLFIILAVWIKLDSKGPIFIDRYVLVKIIKIFTSISFVRCILVRIRVT